MERRNCLYLLSLQARNVHSYLLGFCCPNLYNIYIYGMLGMYSMQGVRPWSNREMAQQAISTTPRSSTAKVWVRNLTNLYAAKFICQLSGSYHHMISPLHHPAPSSQISSSCQTQTTSFSWVPLLHLFLVDALMHLLTQLLDTHSYQRSARFIICCSPTLFRVLYRKTCRSQRCDLTSQCTTTCSTVRSSQGMISLWHADSDGTFQ